MEAENMRNSSFYKSHYTEEMAAAIKAGEISVASTTLPQSLSTASSLPGTIGRLSQEGATGKISKKRSRASRRAHTTVLNTDKANFKTMVQHFTGITSANIAANTLSPKSESFEDYFLSKSMPADHQQYSSARPKSLDVNNPPFAFYASHPQSVYLPNFPFAEKGSTGMIPNFFNSKPLMANNSQRQGMADLSSASLWEEVLGMDLPASGLYRNM
jgi:hypothetical protein